MTEPERHPVCGCLLVRLQLNRRDRRWLDRNGRTAEYASEHPKGCSIAVSWRSTVRPGGQIGRAS